MPMSMNNKEKLYLLLEKRNMRPARTHHLVDGRTAFVWYVDNDDDRYVRVEDSACSQDFLILVRNGREVTAHVLGSVEEVVSQLVVECQVLSVTVPNLPKSGE